LTQFELIIRGMRRNIKHYFLYYFAFIFSTSLYFVFATLQNDSSFMAASFSNFKFSSIFNAAGILVLVIVVVFMVYANHIFLKRRSKEIGLYQLVGLTHSMVARLLITENALLGAGALLIGMGSGVIMSRLFVLILMKLMGSQSLITLSFSGKAALQTMIVFTVLIVVTWMQMVFKVYRSTLLDLFQSDRKGDHPKQPRNFLSAVMGLAGIILILTGYMLSSQALGQHLFLKLLTILGMTILGTYLLFRVTIGWVFYRIRKGKNGHLGLSNSLSLATIMHRMKNNANSLTLITVLSAMTLTMVAISYSLYYSAGSESRGMLPYDFIFENNEQDSKSFGSQLEKAGITFAHGSIEALRLQGKNGSGKEGVHSLLLLTAEELQATGADIRVPVQNEAIMYKGLKWALSEERTSPSFSQTIDFGPSGVHVQITLNQAVDRYAMNYSVLGRQLVISLATMKSIRENMPISPGYESIHIDTYLIADQRERALASGIYTKMIKKDEFNPDFDSYYKESIRKFGLILFIAGFLSLTFLVSTGSILYFMQMTEAEQERKNYTILRQLGFEEREIIGGIIQKQWFVFSIPLVIGLLHSIFAVKAASALTLSDLTIPAAIAMSVYALIYFMFAVLTVIYYIRIVRTAL